MPAGRPRSVARARCPKPEHKGSHTVSTGTYETKSGRRQRYRCHPLTGDAHTFTVVLTHPGPRTRNDEPPPPCPRGHVGKVHLNGTYGIRSQEPRQSYRCIPDDGSKPHKFAALLPRDHVHSGNADCASCRELRGIHRGETAVARRHTWSTRIVVRGLEKLAAGETYLSVTQWALRVEGAGKRSIKGVSDTPAAELKRRRQRWHVAADWCEAFSPVIWNDLTAKMTAETTRAREAGAQVVWLIDSTSFGGRRVQEGLNGGATGERFVLLALTEQFVGGDGINQEPRLRLVRGLPNRTTQAWQLVLSEPGYAPDFVVSDADAGQLGAVASLFPQAVIIPCLFHLRRSLEDSLADVPAAYIGPRNNRELHPSLRAHLSKMTGREHVKDPAGIALWWNQWEDLHRQLGVPTDRLYRQRDQRELIMLAAASSLRTHPKLPLSVGALEATQNTVIRPAFAGRAAGFGNVERTNALLDLIVARQRFVFDDLNHVADLLRGDVLAADGTATPVRWVEDPQPKRVKYASLRDPGLVLDLAEQRGFL